MATNDKKEKQAEMSMEEWHRYYQDVIACLPNLVYVVDKHCILTACNQGMCQLLGIERAQDLHETLYTRLITHTRYSETRINLLKRNDIDALLSAEPQSGVAEPPIVDSEGNILYFEAQRSPLFDKDHHVIGMVVILTNINERKKMEDQFEKIREKLQEFNRAQSNGNPYPANVQRNTRMAPKILMVEDNLLAQKAAQSLLMELDCLVDVADSSEAAIELFKPGKYDLIFMDIGLQETSGYLVSKQIRQIENNTGYRVPIIALTGYEADVVKIDCNEYFMEGAITKPLSSEQARQIIERYVNHIDIPVYGMKSGEVGSNSL